MDPKMFRYQCQETAGCKGCTIRGVCGKSPEVTAMQDLLVYVTRGLSAVTSALRAKGEPVSRGVNGLVATNMFCTITNANFDEAAIRECIARTPTSRRRRRRSACCRAKTRTCAACASSSRTA